MAPIQRPRLALAGVLALLALAGAAVVAPAASAAPPTMSTTELHRHIDPFATCAGFRVIGDFDVVRQDTIYYDEQGTPVRERIHARYTGTLTNAVTGQAVSDNGSRLIFLDRQEGTTAWAGIVLKVVVPGQGLVSLDAGRVVFNADGSIAFEAGPHHDLANDQFAALCAALGAP